jgi:hypothetical protein
MNKVVVSIGDWVCFFSGGVQTIGNVLYVNKNISGTLEYYTSAGVTYEDCILEVRGPNYKYSKESLGVEQPDFILPEEVGEL